MASSKINKSAFVRSLPSTMFSADVVKAAAAKGIKLTPNFVNTIRYNAKKSAEKKSAPKSAASAPVKAASVSAPVKRGRGRPRKDASSTTTASHEVGNGLVAEVERIVEAKVNTLLRERFGALFGR